MCFHGIPLFGNSMPEERLRNSFPLLPFLDNNMLDEGLMYPFSRYTFIKRTSFKYVQITLLYVPFNKNIMLKEMPANPSTR